MEWAPGRTFPRRPHRSIVITIAVVTVVASLAGVVASTRHAVASSPQIAGSVAAPTASDISPICDAPSPTNTLGPATVLTSTPTSTVATPSGGVDNFDVTSSDIYVNTGSQIDVYSLTGTPVSSFTLPSLFANRHDVEISQPVVDPSGDIYLASYYDQIVDKFSPTGQLLWSVDPGAGNPTGLYSVGTGSSFSLAVTMNSHATSDLLNLSTGAVTGTFPLDDDFDFVTQESDGDLLVSGNGYVQTLSPTGSQVSEFGSSKTEGNGVHTGGGAQFYYPAQAVQGPDGTIYTADPLSTIEATSPNGYLEATTTLGGTLSLEGDNFYLVGSTVYYQGGTSGANNISSMPLSTLTAELDAVHVPLDTLGWGASISSTASGNYFPVGTAPSIYASFDPWWTAQASHLQLSYSIENVTSITAETVPAATTVALPTTASGLANIPLTIPSTDQQPGPYQVQATLLDTSTSPPTSLGTTCMPFTVGASGDNLNLASLPAGIGSGGPSDTRGVALNSQLGLDGLRGSQVNWSSLLPDCSPSAPTAATCGPSAMDFTGATESYYQAAYEAEQDHVTYWVQASSGGTGSVETALATNGWWGGDVAELVSHYATVPAGCGQCAPVTMWEPWNEPNNTGWSNGATYVSEVLQPFYAAVKSVLPGSESTVIGGGSLDVAIGWWQQLIAAGGLNDLDVASIHPYTGNNESFEEYGNIPGIEQLEGMLGGKPLWFTEVGWWSDGDYNFLNQANVVARAMIWQKVLNIPVWNYYYSEGDWGNDGVSFSLIQASSTDDYVKPAALATMATSNQLAGRPYLSMPSTGIPQTYQADFGPGTGTPNQESAVWSDGLDTTGSVTLTSPGGGSVPITVTSEYGNATAVSVTSGTAYSLPISDQVTYISYPTGDSLAVGPTQSYGTDLAATTSTNASRATATSGNASAAIAGTTTGSGWSSATGDTTPSLTVTLAQPATINRVVVDTQSVGSTATGVRSYTISADESSGWTTVATETGQFRTHELQLAFAPVQASAVQITVSEINFGGYYGGGIPPFWGSNPGTAFLHALQIYGGTGTVSQVDGTALAPLVSGGTGVPPTTTTTTTTTTTAPPSTTTTTTAPPSTTTTTTTAPPSTTTTTRPPSTTTTTTAPPSTTTTTSPPPSNTNPAGRGADPNPFQSLAGYWLTTAGGGIFSFGQVPYFGSLGAISLNKPIVGMTSTPGAKGYRMVASDGGVFTFGDAGFYGSAASLPLNKPIVGMASTPDGNGYWLVASDGGIFAFGDAQFYGSTGGIALNEPIVGMASTPDGNGYWLVASDGGIFAFGDAQFYGSTGNIHLNKPIVGMAPTSDGNGYWMVASDGGVFAFGDAKFYGSTGGIALNKPISGMAATGDGNGYWLVATDGGIFSFGDAKFYGSAQGLDLTQPALAIS